MRVFLVGSPEDRARLRAQVNGSLRIVGEFATLAAARSSAIETDGMLVAAAADSESAGAVEEPLTPRETQVLELLAEGLPNRVIAGRLGISDQTVKFHVASISGKLGAANRTDAVRRAVRRGLITL
jgi:DNA-binding NarL/FixJ family response regulator